MIAIIDYGVGNLFSLKSSFAAIGEEAAATGDPDIIRKADKLILPGVGAFEDAAVKLKESGIAEVIKEEAASGKPLLGICLGMQLLFDRSLEYGEHDGLGLIKGVVKPMEGLISPELKIPHIGWNPLIIKKEHPLFSKINNGDCVYFVHSFFADECEDAVIATAEYDIELTAAVAKDNIMGCQFHPEKSGDVGLDILKAFCKEM
ncbi:MAG: imidazole glycerol phosphate synthase subunit HisH [Lachnospiraceae bacterium]|nr:imidazole glycerol phosphate synthase subunit HisH [Lachnospiraceae bacterium]